MPPQQIHHVSVKVIQGHSQVEPLTLFEREGHSRSFTGRTTDLD